MNDSNIYVICVDLCDYEDLAIILTFIRDFLSRDI